MNIVNRSLLPFAFIWGRSHFDEQQWRRLHLRLDSRSPGRLPPSAGEDEEIVEGLNLGAVSVHDGDVKDVVFTIQRRFHVIAK